MTHSLLITKYILKILEASDGLKTLLPISKIYPVDARLGTSFPFAVIQRTSLIVNGTKDGYNHDTVNFTIIIVDDTYINCVTIADKVREALEGNGWRDNENNSYLHDIQLTSASESIYDDTFLQQLDFSVDFEWETNKNKN